LTAPRVPAVPDRDEAARRAALARMRWRAASVLGGMLATLGASAALQPAYPVLAWVRAFAEAGAVGALADWYAVVALFRRPLGLPIPHTGIIPANKDRIGATLGQFVEQNFLTPENVVRQLDPPALADAMAAWLADADNSSALAASICDAVPGVLDALADEDIQALLERVTSAQFAQLDVAAIAAQLLTVVVESERHHDFLERALAAVEAWLDANRGRITAKFGEQSPLTPGALDRYIVDRFIGGVVALAHETARDREHPLRRELDAAVRGLIEQLRTSETYRERGRALVADFIEHLRTERLYQTLWDRLREEIRRDLAAEASGIRAVIADALVTLGRAVATDTAVKAKLAAWLRRAAETIVVRHRHHAGKLITAVVTRWDAEEVAAKIELEIGRDLQYIRINGAIVGGLAGLALHGVARAFGA
jgi:uncharacterized membrane-anchored protein YjiN (DUF445 family)